MAAKPSRDMKKSERGPIYKIDEFEDLTLFANESFDTEDVDLFEFSSEESSPLMRLKSVILSLDWEINDEILQELADEVETLQSLWQGDKVAEVYLQGLSKIGGYIRSKGAYAHPNSIKLLLTFFSNFEKIVSSQNITGEEITQLLTSDVRKFRILQFQINQIETETSPDFDETSAASATQLPAAEPDDAKQLKAAILSLDWEVTDESLGQFNSSLSVFYRKYNTDRPALVLVQGLQALGDYIAEKRAEAHPESFILLHSFNEALEQIAKQSLDQDTIQDLLVDRINRLNNLKMLIAVQTASPLDEKLINGVVEEISAPGVRDAAFAEPAAARTNEGIPSPVFFSADSAMEAQRVERQDDFFTGSLEAEIDTLFAMDVKPAMETASVQYPEEILPLDAIHSVDDEVAGDFMEAHLNVNRGLMPALSDAEEVSGYNEDAEPLDLPTQSDLAEQLDFLFADAANQEAEPSITSSALESSALKRAIDDEGQPVAALADVNFEEEGPLERLTLNDEKGLRESADFQNTLDIQSKLDSFFDDADEQSLESEKQTAPPSVEEIQESLFFNEPAGIESALADSEEDRGFSEEEAAAALDDTPMGEIEEKLAFFFGADTAEEPVVTKVETKPAAEIFWPEKQQFDSSGSSGIAAQSLDLDFETTAAEASIAPALSGVASPSFADKQEGLFTDDEILDVEIEGALDFFFEANEDDEEEIDQTTVDELTQTLEASIDAGQTLATGAGGNQQAVTPEEGRQIQLAALGALLPGTVRTLTHEKVTQSTQLIASLENMGLPAGPQALLQLLNTVISLLIRLPKKDDAATEKLVNYLYLHLLEGQYRPEILPEAVTRFTAWLQNASAVMPLVPTETGQPTEPHFEYTAKELYFELSELRSHIREEFKKLRHEMHHQ